MLPPDSAPIIKPSDDPEKLFYPSQLSPHVGLSGDEVAALRRRGCPFFGRKTCLAWVRDFISRESGAKSGPARKRVRTRATASK